MNTPRLPLQHDPRRYLSDEMDEWEQAGYSHEEIMQAALEAGDQEIPRPPAIPTTGAAEQPPPSRRGSPGNA
jgi:hypothetical protein